MATAQDRISSKGARKKAPVVARARDDGRMPSDLTIPQVLHCAGSVTAERILTRSIEFARVLQTMHIHVVGASSLFRAAIAVGCEEPGKETTSANWLADWLARSGPTDRVKKWLDKTRPTGTVSGDAPLTNSAVATLGRAVTLAQRTVERGEFDARHLIAALLLPTKGQMSASVKEDVAEFEANPADFLKLLVSHIRSSPAPAEKTRLNVWDEVAKLQSDIAPAKIASRQRAFLTDYASDIAAGTDQLGIYPDVRSIAELISLRDAQPPLSVGLFGNWGSGKSFFMHMLQQEVDKVTEDARKQTRRSNGKSASPFVDNIVQIQFNAWHYSDANLWVSLTAEFFDQLRVGGFSGSGEATHAALIKQVSKHIQSLESDAARINQHAENLESKAKSMAAAVARNEQALARTELEILTSQIGKQIEKLTKENKDQINEIGQRLFRDDNFADSAHFTTVLSELRTTPAKVALIAQSLFAGGWPTWVAFLGVCAFSLFILLAATDLFAGFANKLTAQFASLVSSMAAATAALWGAYRFVRPMFDGVAAFAKDLATEKKLRADNLTKAQTELATVQAELNTAREKADGAKQRALALSKIRQRSRTRHDLEVFSFRRFRHQGIREAYWSGESRAAYVPKTRRDHPGAAPAASKSAKTGGPGSDRSLHRRP